MRPAAALALILLLAQAGTASSAAREPITIANFADAGPGTLRHALESAARPGDTIRFASAAEIVVRTPITVRRELAGLTIDGATPAGGKVLLRGVRFRSGVSQLSVLADRFTLRNATLVDLPLDLQERVGSGGGVSGPAGVRIAGNTFRIESNFARHRTAVTLGFTRSARVTDNAFEGESGVSLQSTHDTTVAENTFEVRGSAVNDDKSRGLGVRDNTVKRGTAFLDTIGAEIEGNTFGQGRLRVLDYADEGSVRIAGNTVTVPRLSSGIVVAASRRIVVEGNTVTGPDGAHSNGISVECREASPGTAVVRGNTVTKARTGIRLSCPKSAGRFVVEANRLERNSYAGIHLQRGTRVRIAGGHARENGFGILVQGEADGVVQGVALQRNRGAGVYLDGGTAVQVAASRFGGNGGPGIDIAPPGVTPNARRKLGNADQDWPLQLEYVKKTGKLQGVTCRGCRVDVWEAEEGDENGEGLRIIGRATAAGSGLFRFPARGELDCPESGVVTVTVTRPGRNAVTSEFSQDVECACVVSSEFMLDGARVPPTGFTNFGVSFAFPNGSKVGEATLTDTKTDLRPEENALGPQLQWRELTNEGIPTGSPGFFGRDFFVNTFYREGAAGNATGPRVVWKFSVSYEPPRSAKRCAARLIGSPFLPPP